MRTRLTASYSAFSKILLGVFIFVFTIVILAHISLPSRLTNIYPSFEIILLVTAYLVARIITRNRVVIEFDECFFYIVEVSSKQEQKFPLENVIWLNLRPGTIEVSSRFVPFSLHYMDNDEQEQIIKVWVSWLDKPVREFADSIRKKNPDFEFRNSNWTIDYKDQ